MPAEFDLGRRSLKETSSRIVISCHHDKLRSLLHELINNSADLVPMKIGGDNRDTLILADVFVMAGHV